MLPGAAAADASGGTSARRRWAKLAGDCGGDVGCGSGYGGVVIC